MQIVLALSSAFLAAVYFVYTSHVMKNTKGISSGLTLWVSHLLGAFALLPAWWLYSPIKLGVLADATLLVPLLLVTLLLVISRELYYYAYARTDVANITVFSALTPVYTLVTGYFMLGEVPQAMPLLGLLVICGSIYFLFLNPAGKTHAMGFLFRPFVYIVSSRPIFYAFLSTIPTAFAAVYQKTLLTHMDPIGLSFLMLLLIGLFAFCVTLAIMPVATVKQQLRSLPVHFYVVSALMLPLVHVIFCMVMMHQQTAISLVLQRTAIVFQIILAYYFLHEHTNIQKRIGVGCMVMLGFGLIMWGH